MQRFYLFYSGGLEFKPGNDYYFICKSLSYKIRKTGVLIPLFFITATSAEGDIHRRIGGWCSSSNTKVIFKVFGGNDSAKTSTELPSPVNNDHGRSPPRIDTWPSNSWKNHHNDDASSSGDSTNSENDPLFKPNESSNKNFNNGFANPSTQRPIYVNRDNHSNNINSNASGGSNNINKSTKKTS